MATADTRSGFRLPWSSDRPHDDSDQADPTTPAADDAAAAVADAVAPPSWPDSDFAERLGVTPPAPRPADEPVMTQPDAAPAPTPPPARRPPTKLMADLAAAILATTEIARDSALSTVQADAATVTEAIRAASTTGVEALRRQSDGDLAAIKEWSKAEIARIREESEARIEARKGMLATEIAAHAAAVEYRVEEVDDAVARYRADMDTYFERLKTEDDPSHLATLAEAMPEPPALAALADLADLDVAAFVPVDVAEPEPAVTAIEVEAEVAELEVEVAEVEAEVAEVVEPEAVEAEADLAEVETVEAEAELETEALADDGSAAFEAEALEDEVEPVEDEVEPVEIEVKPTRAAWTSQDNAWGSPAGTADADGDDVPRWAAGETPEGFPTSVEGGDPVDRGAIMAALEAAAEAVVAAEAAAESADQAEAAADVAETAAELLVGRHDTDEESDDAKAAMSARVDAGGFDTQSFADRLASLMPGHGDGASDGEPRTTQVVVTGLVSVASIASFKRHLGRLPGVHTVGVASGPEGEFLFNVGHRPDVSFRDVVPSMPGFAARVTGMSDGVVTVSARDPESEG